MVNSDVMVVDILLVLVVRSFVVGFNVVVLVVFSVDLMFVKFEVVFISVLGVVIINDMFFFD